MRTVKEISIFSHFPLLLWQACRPVFRLSSQRVSFNIDDAQKENKKGSPENIAVWCVQYTLKPTQKKISIFPDVFINNRFLISNNRFLSQLSVSSFHLNFTVSSHFEAHLISSTWKIKRLFLETIYIKHSPHKVCQLPVLCLLFHCNRSQPNRASSVGQVCAHKQYIWVGCVCKQWKRIKRQLVLPDVYSPLCSIWWCLLSHITAKKSLLLLYVKTM